MTGLLATLLRQAGRFHRGGSRLLPGRPSKTSPVETGRRRVAIRQKSGSTGDLLRCKSAITMPEMPQPPTQSPLNMRESRVLLSNRGAHQPGDGRRLRPVPSRGRGNASASGPGTGGGVVDETRYPAVSELIPAEFTPAELTPNESILAERTPTRLTSTGSPPRVSGRRDRRGNT